MIEWRRNKGQDAGDSPDVVSAPWYEGGWRFAFYALLAVSLTVLYALSQFRGLQEPLAMETAQIARHRAEGGGWVTDCVRPFDLWYLQSRGLPVPAPDAPHPALWTAPGTPFLQSVLFRLIRPRYEARRLGGHVIDAEARAIVPLGVVLTLLTALTLWGLAMVLFNPHIAFLATAAYIGSDLTLSLSISGLPLSAAALPVTLTLLLAVLAVRRSAMVTGVLGVGLLSVLCALSAAAAVLTDYAMIVVAVMAAVMLGVELQRWRGLMLPLYVLVLLAALLPWGLKQHQAGTGLIGAVPYSALRHTPLFEADTLERTLSPALNAYRVAAAVRLGFVERFQTLARGEVLWRGGVILCFFILAWFFRYENPIVSSLKWLTVAAVTAAALWPALPGSEPGFGWVAFYPVVVLLGMSAFCGLLEKEEYFDPGIKPFLTLLLLILCLLPAALRMLKGPARPYPPYYAPLQKFAAGTLSEGTVLMTDIPWATAWYGRKVSMQIPLNPDAVMSLPGGWERVGGLYLTGAVPATEAEWTLMRLGRQVPETVPLHYGMGLPAAGREQLLLLKEHEENGFPPAREIGPESR